MSDVPSVVTEIAVTAQTIAEPSTPIWPFVLGTIAAIALAGYWGYRHINRPSFIIKQIRKKNLKAMQKNGIEDNDATKDLDKLLTSLEKYAIANNLSGSVTVQMLMPLNDQNKIKSAKDMYLTLHNIARDIEDNQLAVEFKNKMTGVKSNSKLMAGLFKRAGI